MDALCVFQVGEDYFGVMDSVIIIGISRWVYWKGITLRLMELSELV